MSLLILLSYFYFLSGLAQVSLTEEEMVLPTYVMGPDEKHAIFKDYRYPGSVVFRGDRTVYPYTLQEHFTREREDISYQAVCLENKYLQTWVIPDLRGRLQGAIDKRNGWDFIYFNEVIKPADIAIRKAWLAGGLEWNHPGGHGYTQLEKLSYITKEYPDGSKSVIVTEIEPVRHMKWQTEIKLHPDRLYVETTCKLISIAPYPVPFASSLNGAMHTSEELEVIYPKGSHFTGHGKNTMWPWPLFDGKTDARWFKNLKRTFSVFVEGQGLKEDYWGCYSHDDTIDAGTVIVADHRFAPGKKYFTWGSHDKGRIWDSLLSDHNGGYIELQVQAFWDNLGYGYAWLHPQEIKEFTVYWYPIKNMGGFVKATRDICLNIQKETKKNITLSIQATRPIEDARIAVVNARTNEIIYEKNTNLTLHNPWIGEFKLPKETEYDSLIVKVWDDNQQLITYETAHKNYETPVIPTKHSNIDSMLLDQLYARGKSFYQDPFSTEAEMVYMEMLKLDSLESRANRELGLIYYFRGDLGRSKKYLQQSLKNDHLNEASKTFFYLTLVAFEGGKLKEAKEYLAIAGRNKEYEVLAPLWFGKIALKEKKYHQASEYLKEAAKAGANHPEVFNYLAYACRKLNQTIQAKKAIQKSLLLDPLSFPAILEKWHLTDNSPQQTVEIHRLFDRETKTFTGSHLYINNALFYMQIDAWEDAIILLEEGINHFNEKQVDVYPMMHYYLGYCYQKTDNYEIASSHYNLASEHFHSFVFPHQRFSAYVLDAALNENPKDANTWFYKGNLLAYYRNHDAAMKAWEKSLQIDENIVLTMHNLAGAHWYVNRDTVKTLKLLEKALTHAPNDQRIIFELDHLYQAFNMPSKRENLFTNHEAVILQHDELVIRYARFSIETQNYDKAIELMEQTHFFPKEINYEKPYYHTLFAEAHFGKAEFLMETGNYKQALVHIEKGMTYPPNLRDIWPAKPVYNRPFFIKGLAYDGLGMKKKANEMWEKTMNGLSREGSESEYYRALACKKLKKQGESKIILQSLVEYNLNKLKSADDVMDKAMSEYLIGKAFVELNEKTKACEYLNRAFQVKSDVIIDARVEATYIPRTAF